MSIRQLSFAVILSIALAALSVGESVAMQAESKLEPKLSCPVIDIKGLFLSTRYATSSWFGKKDDGTIIELETPGLFASACGYYQFIPDLPPRPALLIYMFWEEKEGNGQFDCKWEMLKNNKKYFLASKKKKAYTFINIDLKNMEKYLKYNLEPKLGKLSERLLLQLDKKAANCVGY